MTKTGKLTEDEFMAVYEARFERKLKDLAFVAPEELPARYANAVLNDVRAQKHSADDHYRACACADRHALHHELVTRLRGGR